MNKDVIYIDVDDDITAIIGKIRAGKEKIVALVPPKRVGVLQSAVNLRLLDRMAKADGKHLVLITNNQALIALSASTQIPVARNLQSKPEVAEIPALIVDNDDDIIDGSQLPVGDHAAKSSRQTPLSTRPNRSDAVDLIDVEDGTADDRPIRSAPSLAAASAVGPANAKTRAANSTGKPKSRVKIPNFDSFRKKLFIGIAAGILLIGVLVWAFVFAPAATVIITARTTSAPVTATVQLGGTAATDVDRGIIRSVSQEQKTDESIEFDATGQEDVGERATGTVRFSTNSISNLGIVIPAGTQLTAASGAVFSTNESATITINNYTGQNIGVTAIARGADYNGATGSLSGAPSGVSAALTAPTAGGTSRIVKIVSGEDVERAQGQLVGKSTDQVKKDLIKKFTNSEIVIDSSFIVTRGPLVSSPAAGAEAPASGKAKLTIPTTYTITALPKSDVEAFLNDTLEKQIDSETTQRIYSNGVDKVGIGNFSSAENITNVTITAEGQIGPRINEDDIKNQVKGKIFGDVQSTLEAINGIESVDVTFSYPWVRSVPNDNDKIRIEFQLQDES